MISHNGPVYRMYSNGPITDPCGTPHGSRKGFDAEIVPLIPCKQCQCSVVSSEVLLDPLI